MREQSIEEIAELKELILKSLRDSDLPYMRRVQRIWGITTAIGFIVTHFLFKAALAGHHQAGPSIWGVWAIIFAISLILQRLLYPRPAVTSYFSRIYLRFWFLAFLAIAISWGLGLMGFYPHRFIGALIAIIVGLEIGTAGILFRGNVQLISGIIYMCMSWPIASFWRDQFLIFAGLHIFIFIIGPLFWKAKD